MTNEELRAIRERCEATRAKTTEGAVIVCHTIPLPDDVRASADDIPTLLAEVGRLKVLAHQLNKSLLGMEKRCIETSCMYAEEDSEAFQEAEERHDALAKEIDGP